MRKPAECTSAPLLPVGELEVLGLAGTSVASSTPLLLTRV